MEWPVCGLLALNSIEPSNGLCLHYDSIMISFCSAGYFMILHNIFQTETTGTCSGSPCWSAVTLYLTLLQRLFSAKKKNSPGVLSPRCHNNLTQHAIKVTYGFLPCQEKWRVLSKGCCHLIFSVFVVLLCIRWDKVVPLHVFVYFSLVSLCEKKEAVQYRRSLACIPNATSVCFHSRNSKRKKAPTALSDGLCMCATEDPQSYIRAWAWQVLLYIRELCINLYNPILVKQSSYHRGTWHGCRVAG